MRIAAYVHMKRTLIGRGPTGVGKHLNQMVTRLAKLPGVDLSVLAAAEDLVNGKIPDDSGIVGLPVRPISWKRKIVELSWLFLNRPNVERWSGDVDWVYCPAEAYVAARAACRAVAIHGIDWFEPDVPWYNDVDVVKERRAWKSRFARFRSDVELLLPVSNFLAGRLTALFGIRAEKMRVVSNGVEDAYYTPGPLTDQLKAVIADRPYVLAVGGLTRRKGANCILNVARDLQSRKSDIQVLVAGRHEPQFETEAAQLTNLVLCGYVSVETGLPALLHSSVALLYPSRYDTFGIPIAEAMAAGTPAIVSNHAACPEIAGEAGIIVSTDDVSTIVDQIHKLARDEKLRQKHITWGQSRAEQFRWQSCAQQAYAAMSEYRRS